MNSQAIKHFLQRNKWKFIAGFVAFPALIVCLLYYFTVSNRTPPGIVDLPSGCEVLISRNLPMTESWPEGDHHYTRAHCTHPPKIVADEMMNSLKQVYKDGELSRLVHCSKNDIDDLKYTVQSLTWPRIDDINRQSGWAVEINDSVRYITYYFWPDNEGTIIETIEGSGQ